MTTPKKPTPRPTVRIEQVGPALADKWLGTQLRNRNLRDSRVEWMCAIIERGEWKLTNDAITFDTEGHLLNGQHRLTAIVVSEVTVPLIVLRGLEPVAQDVMDTGLVRKTSDALKLRGEHNVFPLASGLRWEHKLRYIESNDSDAVHYGAQEDRPTTPHLLSIFDEDPDGWREMVKLCNGMNRIGFRQSVATACFKRFWALSPEDAAVFHEKIFTGENLSKNSPILQVRNMVSRPENRRRRQGVRMPDYREAALLCKAWNLYRDGDRRSTLTWHYGGSTREAFPVPR